ncbi:RDD family protein [Ensifer sp. 22521]|uniref:RDD family protein n=1 Tax=Ensifer sp. 22521 TaxID=3453935 RepID=UPI003F829C38
MTDSVENVVSRAGFWRRAIAFLIDFMLVALPMQAVVVVLFMLTGGAVQASFGFHSTVCEDIGDLLIAPTPPPPADYNSVVECRVTLAGFDLKRTLTVSKITVEAGTTTRISQTYYLGPDGKQRDVWPVDFFGFIVFLAYLVVLESRRGATLGKQLLSIRTASHRDAFAVGVPVRSALLRYAVMFAAVVPGMLVTLGFELAVAHGAWDPFVLLTHPFFVGANILAGLIFVGWFAWITVSVIRKRDPVYDRAAGTSVWVRR